MKIRNPDWHPPSWNCLTAAQRRNLRILAGFPANSGLVANHQNMRNRKSLDSLVRHGLAVLHMDLYKATDKGREWGRNL